MNRSRTIRASLRITCNMVPRFVCVWLLIFFAAGDGADETKRDKRTVDILLRGAADLFGYDVVRRITSPSLRQTASTPRPTFFPPPVAPQLPPGSYSRVILALGQQQQEQQQQLQRRLEESLQVPPPQGAQAAPQPVTQQQAVINIPQNGALTASAEAIHFPPGGLFSAFQAAQAPAEQAPLLSALRATLTAGAPAPQVQQAAPASQQAPSTQQAAPASPPQAPAQQTLPNNGNSQQSFGIPLQIVAIAPAQGFGPLQSQAPESVQSSPPQSAQQSVPTSEPPPSNAQISPSAVASAANSRGPQQAPPQQQANAFNIVLDQGPTRWNLFSSPRQESVRRSLSLNLNWNRNAEPAPAAQLQLVPVPLETTPTPPQQVLLPQQTAQQQQLPPPTPTIENFDITTAPPNPASAFNRYYNIPDNFQARSAAQRQNDANVKFQNTVRQFWESAPWTNENRPPQQNANLREEVNSPYEEYNLEPNTEELQEPESEQLVEENNEVIAPSNESNTRREYSEQNREDQPKFRRRNKIRRIRKVKKDAETHRREKKSLEVHDSDANIKNYYKKFKSSAN